jgi:hypothetical protein
MRQAGLASIHLVWLLGVRFSALLRPLVPFALGNLMPDLPEVERMLLRPSRFMATG